MNENISKQDRVKFSVDKENIFIRGAILFMAASAVLRIIGCWGYWDNAFYTTTQIVLPIVCNVLFALSLMLLGRKFFSLSSIPVILGAVFFIIKATEFVWWKMLISIIAYIATAFLYSATAFGIVRTKWPLVPVFGLPFIIHVIYDFSRLGDKVNPVTLSDGLQEISVLCILLSLLFTALAMKKPKSELEKEKLPKIKAPKIFTKFKNKDDSQTETAACEENSSSEENNRTDNTEKENDNTEAGE